MTKYYNGKPCKNCGDTLKYKSNRTCVACKNARQQSPAYKAVTNRYNASLVGKRTPEEKAKRSNQSGIWNRNNSDNRKANQNRRRTRKTKAGGSFTADEWRGLCNHYGNVCLKCGGGGKLTADHIIAIANGGTSNIDNIQPLCQSCNASKGAKNTDYRGGNFVTRWIQERLV